MTEQEWLECQNPRNLFTFVEKSVLSRSRKTRLLAVAACEQVRSLLTDERSRSAVRLAERLADNNATEQERIEAESSATAAFEMARERWGNADDDEIAGAGIGYWAASAAKSSVSNRPWDSVAAAGMALHWIEHDDQAVSIDAWAGWEVTGGPWPALIHEIFGNPFHSVKVDPSWLTWHDDTILKIAQSIYSEPAFASLSVLADALEEAGCTNAEILGHCRGPVRHVRGCWVVDLVRGKN